MILMVTEEKILILAQLNILKLIFIEFGANLASLFKRLVPVLHLLMVLFGTDLVKNTIIMQSPIRTILAQIRCKFDVHLNLYVPLICISTTKNINLGLS